MERTAQVDKSELVRRMRERFEAAMAKVAESVNAAPDGQWIKASEESCREVLGEFRQDAYQTALQMRIEAAEKDAAFSPSGEKPPRSGG